MKNTFFFCIVLTLSISCKSEFRRAQLSTDMDHKYKMAVDYYEKADYFKALPLFEELITAWRGIPKAEKVYYYYAYTEYQIKNYQLAAYHFKKYAENYAGSDKAQECEFMYANCLYLDSPNFTLDQSSTEKATEALQLFINKYPQSEKVSECNMLIDKLRNKLEEKSFNTAMLFYRMEDYRAASTMLEQTLKEFPDIDNREEIEFLILQSDFRYADNSILSKQEERYSKMIKDAEKFLFRNKKSKYVSKVEDLISRAEKKREDALQNIEDVKRDEILLEIF